MVGEMLAKRGICVTYETVRQWGKKFGKAFSDQTRKRAPARRNAQTKLAVPGRGLEPRLRAGFETRDMTT